MEAEEIKDYSETPPTGKLPQAVVTKARVPKRRIRSRAWLRQELCILPPDPAEAQAELDRATAHLKMIAGRGWKIRAIVPLPLAQGVGIVYVMTRVPQ